jgi:hypothetical protein
VSGWHCYWQLGQIHNRSPSTSRDTRSMMVVRPADPSTMTLIRTPTATLTSRTQPVHLEPGLTVAWFPTVLVLAPRYSPSSYRARPTKRECRHSPSFFSPHRPTREERLARILLDSEVRRRRAATQDVVPAGSKHPIFATKGCRFAIASVERAKREADFPAVRSLTD